MKNDDENELSLAECVQAARELLANIATLHKQLAEIDKRDKEEPGWRDAIDRDA